MNDSHILQLQRIDKYLTKIIVLYCAWTIISFPLTVYGYIQSENSILECIFSYVKYFLFVGKLYNSYHLWYLLALIYAVFAIRFMIKKKIPVQVIVIVALLFYMLSQFMLYYMEGKLEYYDNELLSIIVSLYQFVFNKGGVFTGMLYVVVGMLIAQKRKYLNKYLCMATIITVNICEPYCNIVLNDCLQFIETVMFFMLVLSVEIRDRTIYHYMRKASTIIYLSHLLCFYFYSFIIINNPNKLGLDSFIATSLLALLNACFLMWITKYKKFEWIKRII